MMGALMEEHDRTAISQVEVEVEVAVGVEIFWRGKIGRRYGEEC